MKNKINLLLLSLLILLTLVFNACKKESDLEKIDDRLSASSLDNVLSKEQKYLNLLNTNPNIQYQWGKKGPYLAFVWEGDVFTSGYQITRNGNLFLAIRRNNSDIQVDFHIMGDNAKAEF
jgi:hypothetical protein